MAALTFFSACDVSAQGWEKLENLPETEFTVITEIDGTVYTASGNTLYTSQDNGESWTESELLDVDPEVEITVFSFFKMGETIFMGTGDGIFSSHEDDILEHWTQEILTWPVIAFTLADDALYASTYGDGILKYTADEGEWNHFSEGLTPPHLVYNIMHAPAGLYAVAGGNGAFYKYDTEAEAWTEDFYTGEMEAGVEMEDGEVVGNTMYVSSKDYLLRSDDGGENWAEDQEGLPTNGLNRYIHKGQNTLYAITLGGANTFLNRRPLNAAEGTSWAENADNLPWFSNSICESGNKVFIAATDGVYASENVMAVGPGVKFENTFIYPNPSVDGLFRLQTPLTIDIMNIFDMTGRLIYSAEGLTGLREFVLSQEGVYVVVLNSGDATATQKLIVKK